MSGYGYIVPDLKSIVKHFMPEQKYFYFYLSIFMLDNKSKDR